MPEPQDPITQLENFGNGGIVTTPLEPAAVRSLGDRRRARRTALLTALAAAAVFAVVVPTALVASRDNGGSSVDPVGTPGPTATSGTPSAPPVPEVITYPGTGVEISAPDQVHLLTGTSTTFKAFIAEVARRANQDGAACPAASHGVTVQKYSSAGYAIGGVNSCGGYAALWVDRDGSWQEGMGTQDAWNCDTLSYLKVPKSFAGECFDEAGGFGPTTVNDLRLGMTAAQVTAAGGSLGQPGEGCRSVQLSYQPAVPAKTDGYFSPTIGLAAVFARPGMTTPERIGLGSSLAKLRDAYPTARTGGNGYWVVTLSDDTEYEFGIEKDGTVGEMLLTRTDQDCFG
ncbi:hypothetical protein ABIE44_003471 [Marmoricola sp. OAE513]|uniref:hypothetical protein n=1 Tax=Marmoricola sp. OAE513 TaxID=2817894 RepID=UPI001AEB4F0E